ncbi:MAG: hypothetical protein ACR2GK_09020 [Gemmatimonadaceae bacterium]
MKRNVALTVTSLLSAILFSIHWADDVVRGLDSVGLKSLIGVLILVVWLSGTLVLGERRSGQIIILLASLLAVGVAVVHLQGAGIGTLATSGGGFRFIWTLFALGVTGAFSFVLVVREMWRARSAKAR